ncbi:SusE domain-containing protein [Gelidibacter maritimus]|uniref:SusE domain-containing protein n=1 Tax=Gelidibacter maritimus TaxID=2761487 RepID=A0A7W2R4B6_9FLAO|nr:SusE domain-containing protein [Gelidibacter maritimus]MBA6153553.1 SusE domain-containing protein [Gelidibacter maritimus]
MKNFKIFSLFILAMIGLNSCETDDDVVFIAQEPGEFVLTNSILPEYVLTSSTGSNLGERFTWNSADFGVPTNVSYDLQRSVIGDFSDAVLVGTTGGNEIAMTIGQMMAVAAEAGLDNNPATPEPNTGSFSVRVRAYAGGGGSNTEIFSDTKTISVVLQEAQTGGSGISESTWGIVGGAYNDWADTGIPDGKFYTTSTENVLVSYVSLLTGEIKFRENNAWDNNLGDDGADGSLEDGGANIEVTEGDYKITLNLNDNTYTIEEFSWGIVGDGYNNWGEDGMPDAKFYYDYLTDTFKVGVRLIDGEIKFRTNNEWGNDFGDNGLDGTLDAGGDNIEVTAGHYAITLDFNSNTYTIEQTDIWGIVGSGYNDWGNDGPDFALTEVQPKIWIGDIATFVDGDIKFRLNNAWDTDFGDDGADGTLEAGGDDIAVLAGKYRIRMDLNDNTYKLNKIE